MDIMSTISYDLNEYLAYIKKTTISEKQYNLLVEYAQRLTINGLPVIWNMKHFSIILDLKMATLRRYIYAPDANYHTVNIPKRRGGTRELSIPSLELKAIQTCILRNILEKIKVSEYAFAFIKSRSIVVNAEKHINKNFVLNLDLKDFFGSIKFDRVFRVFYYLGYTKKVSYMLSKLVTKDGALPQGAPTSPYLSNIICLKLDKRLSGLAKKYGLSYSRYADDITFSGFQNPEEYLTVIYSIIKEEKFIINFKKTRIQSQYYRQEVTGLVVNKKLRVDISYKRYLRQQIYYISKFGIDNHLEKIECNLSGYKEHLYGIAYFIKMVEKLEGEMWLKRLDEINWLY